MDNNASLTYGAILERLYVNFEGKIVLANGIGPEHYIVDDVKFLIKCFQDK